MPPNLPQPSTKGVYIKYNFNDSQEFARLEDKAVDGQLGYSDFSLEAITENK